MKRKSTYNKRITIDKAIERYYNSHKNDLLQIFGSERSAKAHLKYDVSNMPANYFSTKKHATEVFNDYIESITKPVSVRVKNAKREALINTPNVFGSGRELNNKIVGWDTDKYGNQIDLFVNSNKALGRVGQFDDTLIGYYEIKNSDQVLALVSHYNGKTRLEGWQFLDKGLV